MKKTETLLQGRGGVATWQAVLWLLVGLLLGPNVQATTFVVNNTNDTGTGSLRQAVLNANADASATATAPHVIVFEASVFNIPRSIILGSALSITRPLRIQGPAAPHYLTLTRTVNVLRLLEGTTPFLEVQNLIFTNGNGTNGGVINNGTGRTAVFVNCQFLNNINTGNGGAIANNGTLLLQGCYFSGNNGQATGGAIRSNTTLTIEDCWFENNTSLQGGVVYLGGGTATIRRTTFAQNTATDGGGAIWVNAGSILLENSTLYNNIAANSGGAVRTQNNGTAATLLHCTVVGNHATTGIGGGLHINNGTISLSNSLIMGNVAGSTASPSPDMSGTFASALGHNLIGQPVGINWVAGSVTTGNNVGPVTINEAVANALTNNGGFGPTLALVANSPAINAGTASTLTADQRGNLRTGRPDIGAFEASNTAPSGLSLDHLSIDEINSIGERVGLFAATDPDPREVISYTLVGGVGSENNGNFELVGNELRAAISFRQQLHNPQSIRVRANDAAGAFTEAVFNIQVNFVLNNIALNNLEILENEPIGSLVAQISSKNPDDVFSLVAGEGSEGNAAFTTVGNELRTNALLDFETQSAYPIRLRVTSAEGALERAFVIRLVNVNEAPNNLAISNLTIKERSGAGAVVGTLSATDPDAGDVLTYSLVSGEGDADNTLFSVVGSSLRLAFRPDYETATSHSIRVRITDISSLLEEQVFVVQILDVDETPKTFYVAANGNDANDGLSEATPWQTTTRVNQQAGELVGGDRILFRRGNVIRGDMMDLRGYSNGDAGNPIVFGAYGHGAELPVLNGAKIVPADRWTQHPNMPNVWSANVSDLTALDQHVYHLFVNDQLMQPSRYPNNGFLFSEAGSSGRTIVTSDPYINSKPDGYWVDARVVYRPRNWVIESRRVSASTTNSITAISSFNYPATANWGFFIVNKIEEIDQPREWAFDAATGTIHLYFPEGTSPAAAQVELTNNATPYAIRGLNSTEGAGEYVAVENLAFAKHRRGPIRLEKGNIAVQHTFITQSGETGIWAAGSNNMISHNMLLDNIGTAITVSGSNHTLTHNHIERAGLDLEHIGTFGYQRWGMNISGTQGGTVAYNHIEHVGSSGIGAGNAGYMVIEKNIIDRSCAGITDNGAIYFVQAGASIATSTIRDNIIRNNLITNTLGYTEGTRNLATLVQGFDISDYSINTLIENNTLVNSTEHGLKVFGGQGNVFKANVVFGSGTAAARISEAQPLFPVNTTLDNRFEDNLYVTTSPSQFIYNIQSSDDTWADMYSAKNNVWVNPFGREDVQLRFATPTQFGFNYFDRFRELNPDKDSASVRSRLQLQPYKVLAYNSPNLIANGAFDSDVAGWTSNLGVAMHDSTALDGGALRVDLPATGTHNLSTSVSLQSGQWYEAAFSVQGSALARLRLYYEPATPGTGANRYFEVNASRLDHRFYFQAANTATGDIQLRSEATDLGRTFWLDNFSIKAVDIEVVPVEDQMRILMNPSDEPLMVDNQAGLYLDLDGLTPLPASFSISPWYSRVVVIANVPILSEVGGELRTLSGADSVITIAPALQLRDHDSPYLAQATARIATNHVAGFTKLIASGLPSGITAAWSDSTGVLTLAGSATVGAYQAALQAVQLVSSLPCPDGLTRTVVFRAFDGEKWGNEAAQNILLAPIVYCEMRLEASKSYGPSRWANGQAALCQPAPFHIPATLQIVSGNAGNHWSFIRLTDTVGRNITLAYKGGASQANPVGATQIALGQRYHYVAAYLDYNGSIPPVGTVLGLKAGDVVTAQSFIMTVNGSSRFGTTVVEAIFDGADPSCTAVARRQAMPDWVSEATDAQPQLAVFPNPSGGQVFLTLNMGGESLGGELRIHDLTGRTVWQAQARPTWAESVDLSHLQKGLYVVRFVGENGLQLSTKLVID